MTDSTQPLEVELGDALTLRVRTGPDHPDGGNHLCYVDIIEGDEQIASINSPSKPWENFTRAMVSQIVAKRVDGYSSAAAVNDRMFEAFEARKAEFDDIYGWE
ncbi:hypothetical protein [Haladaptatus sp. DJG-WS-42]|uniref:hypothetical protein n=1 Tax=Haladaptatus sp. DJG-WS-42 TaxID=3120516 RepID=UPI0030D54889